MHAIRRKLQSRRGASLTFALLLFMVCAVIGSLVLVAGTAAAGRLKGLGESEQRFHAVNSAAELIVDQLCGDDNKVTVGIKKNAVGSTDLYTVILQKDNSTEGGSTHTASDLAVDLAKYLVFGTVDDDDMNEDTEKADLFEACEKNENFLKPHPFVYEVKVDTGGGSGESKVPDVRVTAKFINGYQLNLVIENIVEAGKTDAKYTLPTIILETDSPRGVNEEDKIEYTFNWRTPKG